MPRYVVKKKKKKKIPAAQFASVCYYNFKTLLAAFIWNFLISWISLIVVIDCSPCLQLCFVPRHLSLDKDLRPNVRVSPFFFLLSVVPCASSQVTRGRSFAGLWAKTKQLKQLIARCTLHSGDYLNAKIMGYNFKYLSWKEHEKVS